ncbi:hypothetical protein FRC04_006887 [Tulasnella sp. 424]|nr:hypothetical protein FRC04_006887 [Tulasnella sp. 424]KAG8974392.1 hypothetical protein FRC05_007553 [Tulasnella sp. 425]
MPRAETSQRRHYAKETNQPYGPRDNYVQPAYRAATLSPRQLEFAPGIPSLGTIPANPNSDHPEGTYALEPDESGSYQGFPSVDEFEEILENYLKGLSQRKQEKALITQEMYDCIHAVLMDPTNTTYGTPQFRFWVRKMFVLACFQGEYTVTHEDKPVAAKEQIYQILVHCHGECYHGGRDKTCAQIKGYYSWIPKELVAQFVKACPTCVLKRSNNPKKFVAMLKDISGSHQGAEEQYIDFITSPLRNRAGPSPRGSAGSNRSGDNASSSSASKPDPRLFAHPVRPLLSYDPPQAHHPSLMQLAGSNLSHAAPAPPVFTPGALEEAKPMFRDASGSTTSSLASMFSDSGYGSNVPVSAVDQNQAQGWAQGGSSGAGGGSASASAGGYHLGVPGAVEMNRGLARSCPGDFGHPHGAAAAGWAAQGLAPHGYLGLPQIKLEAAETISLRDPESPSPLPSRALSATVIGGGVRRLGAPASIDLSGSNFNDYRGSSPLLSAVSVNGSVVGLDAHHYHHHHHHATPAGSVPPSATEAFFTVPPHPPVSAPAGGVYHFDHLGAGHYYIPSAPTSATAETFGALDLSRRPSMDGDFLDGTGLDVLSYAAMDPAFAAAINASATAAIHHHHNAEDAVARGEITHPNTRSPSPLSDPALLAVQAAAAVAPSLSRASSGLGEEEEEDEGENADAAGELEIEGLGDLVASAKEAAEAVEQEFDVFA